MNTYANKKGFTIAELVVALLLISCIAMILMPIVFNDSKKQVLMTALNKNYNTLLEIHQTIPMLQARGKIPPSRRYPLSSVHSPRPRSSGLCQASGRLPPAQSSGSRHGPGQTVSSADCSESHSCTLFLLTVNSALPCPAISRLTITRKRHPGKLFCIRGSSTGIRSILTLFP